MNETNLEDTNLLYLNNTYLFETQTSILYHGNDAKGKFIVLAETVFYPQGGGQPFDVGTIDINKHTLNVIAAFLFDGKVHHYIKEEFENIEIGASCHIKIDEERRLKNAKSHTSGHLLASIVENLAPELIGIKGYHFPEGPYVEFKGKLKSYSNEQLIERVSAIAKEKIEENTNISIKEEQPEIQANQYNNEYQLQLGKKVRLIEINGFKAVPCGGTHLKNLSELKELTIRKIQSQKENTRISYSFK
jgi:Ser-tRNA(Ala) deacylase AlaX